MTRDTSFIKKTRKTYVKNYCESDGPLARALTSFRLLYRPNNEEQLVRVYELLQILLRAGICSSDDRKFNGIITFPV